MAMRGLTSWRKEILHTLEQNHETWKDIISCTLTDPELDKEFDSGYGGMEGLPFTAWSQNFVYFPVCYDGAEWCGSAPRHPCDVACDHQGGG